MLAALEELLSAEGVDELRLHVYAANEPGQGLYAAAGYEVVGRRESQVQLRKRLLSPNDRAE
jgi:ribosomal protein S18 acetylase RimI-like enzyme